MSCKRTHRHARGAEPRAAPKTKAAETPSVELVYSLREGRVPLTPAVAEPLSAAG